jgi:hypothetical protein
MTLQQVVGLATVISVSVTGTLVAAEATTAIPTAVILAATVVSGALGAANVYLGSLGNMAKSLVRKGGAVPAHIQVDVAAKKLNR